MELITLLLVQCLMIELVFVLLNKYNVTTL